MCPVFRLSAVAATMPSYTFADRQLTTAFVTTAFVTTAFADGLVTAT